MHNVKRSLVATIVICLTGAIAMMASPSGGELVPQYSQLLTDTVAKAPSAARPVDANVTPFHFLEPLATRAGDPTKFDASLLNYLSVEVCQVTSAGCTVVKTFDSRTATSEQLRIESGGGWTYFITNWDTQRANLNNKTYRVRVLFAGLQLGSLDLTPDVYTRFGRTWPIKFLVEKDPALHVRLVRWLGQSCSKAASVLKLEFNLSASETATLLAADPKPCSESEIQVAIDGVYQNAIIPDTTKISDDLTKNALTSYDRTTGRMIFSSETLLLKRLNVNDVLVSDPGPNAPSGYLRKISSKRRDQGRIILETVQAKLTEAITRGTLNASGDIIAAG